MAVVRETSKGLDFYVSLFVYLKLIAAIHSKELFVVFHLGSLMFALLQREEQIKGLSLRFPDLGESFPYPPPLPLQDQRLL